jgi:D-aspartate ligase
VGPSGDGRALACVLGSLDLIRALGLAGIRCVTVAEPGTPQAHSRFATQVIPWTAFWSNPTGLVTELLRFAATQPEPPVLYFEHDSHLLLVARHRARLAGTLRFVLADPELIEEIVNKDRFRRLAERLDLPVPPSRCIRPADFEANEIGLRFPLIVKPLVRSDEWDAAVPEGKALAVGSLPALHAIWPRLVTLGMDLLVQEMVPGPESMIESYQCYVDAQGEVAGEFTGRKIRTLPLAFGHSTAIEITDQPDLVALGRDMMRRTGLRGVAELEFKRGPDGRLHLLEINPRFTFWHHLGAVAGVNLPAMVHADLTGTPRPKAAQARAGTRWCTPVKDFVAARQAGVGLRAWLPWALGCEAKAMLNLDDPMPAIWRLRQMLALPGAAARDKAHTRTPALAEDRSDA